jgi:hypothetical protein
MLEAPWIIPKVTLRGVCAAVTGAPAASRAATAGESYVPGGAHLFHRLVFGNDPFINREVMEMKSVTSGGKCCTCSHFLPGETDILPAEWRKRPGSAEGG